VKDQIAKERKQQQVFDQMQQLAERVREELAKAPQQAQQIAARLDVNYVHVDKYSQGTAVPEFGNNPDFNDAITSIAKNGVTQVMQAPGNKLAVAVVTGVQPERQAELPEVQDQIRQQIVSMKAMDLLNKRAADALAKAKADGGDLKKVAQSMGLEVKSTQEFTQDGAADGIGPATAVRQGFEEPVGAVFGPVPVSDGRFICKVANRIPADMGKLPEQRAGVVAALKQQKGRQQVELFMDSVRNALTREGKVKIHQDVFDRVINSYKG
jgi:peptidyl-prolyl cis-trans isomerase D